MRGIMELTIVEMKLFVREPAAAFFTLVFPLMMLFLFGSIYGNQRTSFFGGYGYVDVAIPAFIGMIIATTSLMSLPIEIASYKERGVLRRLRLTPLGPVAVLVAVAGTSFVMTLGAVLLQVIAGKLFYDARPPASWLNVGLGFLLSSATFLVFGFAIAGVLPTARTTQVVSMAVFFPMLFLSGATIPAEALPSGVRAFNQVLPLTHAVTLLRGLWAGNAWSDELGAVFFLAATLVACLLISARTFRWE
jgi:ABC-2 type transport system permease protein